MQDEPLTHFKQPTTDMIDFMSSLLKAQLLVYLHLQAAGLPGRQAVTVVHQLESPLPQEPGGNCPDTMGERKGGWVSKVDVVGSAGGQNLVRI